MKTYKELGYLPDMLIANDAGFADTEFVKTLGKDAEYVISREVWALDIGDKKPLIKKVDDAVQGPLQDRLHRQLGAQLHRPDGAGRRHQPRRQHRPRGDPQGAGRHQHARRPR